MKKSAILLGVIACVNFSILAGEGPAVSLLSPAGLSFKGSVQYRRYASRQIENQQERLTVSEFGLKVRIPVYRYAKSRDKRILVLQSPVLNLQFHRLHLSTKARLPDSGEVLPQTFSEPVFQLGFLHQFQPGKALAISAAIRSPSDSPFYSMRETVFNTEVAWSIPGGKKNKWIFYVNWGNNRPFWDWVPLPGFAYRINLSPQTQFTLGLPNLSFRSLPFKWLHLSGSYEPVKNIILHAAFPVSKYIHPFISFVWENKSYLRRDRVDRKLKLFHEQKTIQISFLILKNWNRSSAVKKKNSPLILTSATLNFGWSFDRLLFEGQTYSDRSTNRIDIKNGWFIDMNLKLRL